MGTIGFVVWGIRNGFKNNWLAANVDVNVYQHLTDDMRQICNSTVDTFFSIEKIQDYTLLSIFNPNTKDHVQRKAYIALSIVIPNGYFLKGDVIGTLHTMMQTYSTKQGNAMVNMVNAEDMKVHLQQLHLTSNPNTVPHERTKIGLFSYSDASEINAHFQDPSIYEFKKVFFISGQNVALEKMQGIQPVHAFSKPLFLTVRDFDPKYFQVTINNQQISAAKSPIKTGDLIQFVERKSKRGKQLQVGASDVQVSMLELFPPVIKPPKPKGKNKSKMIIFTSVLLGLVGGVIYFLLPSAPGTLPPDIDDPAPRKKSMTAVYDFESLQLNNLPLTDDSTSYSIFQLSNDTIAIGTVNRKNSVFAFTKLRATVDTLITIKYNIEDSLFSVTIPVEFKIPEVYTIKAGEGLSKIAERFNIKKDSLMHWNNITDENKIKEGQELKLAPEKVTTEQPVDKEKETPQNNSGKVETTPTTEKPKPNEQPAPDAGNSQNVKEKETEIEELYNQVIDLINKELSGAEFKKDKHQHRADANKYKKDGNSQGLKDLMKKIKDILNE